MKTALLILIACSVTPLALSAQRGKPGARLQVVVQPGDTARAALEAIRFVKRIAPDSFGIAACALENVVGTGAYSDVVRPAIGGDVIALAGRPCDPSGFQLLGKPVIYVEKVKEIRSNNVLPAAAQVEFEVTLQTIRGEVQEWQVLKVQPYGLDYSKGLDHTTIRAWRVVKFEVTGYLQTYFKRQGTVH